MSLSEQEHLPSSHTYTCINIHLHTRARKSSPLQIDDLGLLILEDNGVAFGLHDRHKLASVRRSVDGLDRSSAEEDQGHAIGRREKRREREHRKERSGDTRRQQQALESHLGDGIEVDESHALRKNFCALRMHELDRVRAQLAA
jgi:hypothetical protein